MTPEVKLITKQRQAKIRKGPLYLPDSLKETTNKENNNAVTKGTYTFVITVVTFITTVRTFLRLFGFFIF
jgi:hypothetical protein